MGALGGAALGTVSLYRALKGEPVEGIMQVTGQGVHVEWEPDEEGIEEESEHTPLKPAERSVEKETCMWIAAAKRVRTAAYASVGMTLGLIAGVFGGATLGVVSLYRALHGESMEGVLQLTKRGVSIQWGPDDEEDSDEDDEDNKEDFQGLQETIPKILPMPTHHLHQRRPKLHVEGIKMEPPFSS